MASSPFESDKMTIHDLIEDVITKAYEESGVLVTREGYETSADRGEGCGVSDEGRA